MTEHYRELLITPRTRSPAERVKMGSANSSAELNSFSEPDRLGESEAMFIGSRDSIYVASVGASGWPYIQHRGGPPGFVKILGNDLIGFADFRGNRQYISVGNIATENRVSLFFMDYARRARLKLLGRMRSVDLNGDPELAHKLIDADYGAKVERGLLVTVEAFDWNCPQHITPRVAASEVASAFVELQNRVAELEKENADLKGSAGSGRLQP